MTAKRSGDAGLSLIEVLVSLAIFAVIGVAGLAVLNTVARTGERTEGRLERLADIDRAFLVIRRDLAQTVGEVTLSEDTLAFRRAQAQATVKINYVQQDATLVRQVDVPLGQPIGQSILTDISGAQWRLLDGARNWHSVWPPVGSQTPGRPLAAELTLGVRRAEISEPQLVTRLIVLPAGQGR